MAIDLLALGKHLYISTGAHSEEEVTYALNLLPPKGWTPLHCISNYPSKIENAKLGYISYLKEKWRRDVGYSSHDDDWEVCLLALSFGASVVERHITLDKNSKGLDHSSSSTSDEFLKLTTFANKFPKMLSGNCDRTPNQGERLNKQNLGRSYYFNKNVNMGETLKYNHLEYKSPSIGIGKQEIQRFINKPLAQQCKKGDVLSKGLFSKKVILPEDKINFVKQHKISLPVRFHDYDLISELFPINSFELHLSYQETLSNRNYKFIKQEHQYSIHLPDYINENELIDPLSSDEFQKNLSLQIIDKVTELCLEIQSRTGKKVPIVGSFSVLETSKDIFYERLRAFIENYLAKGVSILPQWLPPVAWYFGGSVALKSMCDAEDAEYLKKFNIPICMDFCHLFMGRAYYGFSTETLLNNIRPLIQHIHIADSKGFDGEGIQFGEGEPQNLDILKNYIDTDCLKVIEVWQGHLDQGLGFREAITKLEKFYD